VVVIGPGMRYFLRVSADLGYGLINLLLFYSAITVELAHLLRRVACILSSWLSEFLILNEIGTFYCFLFSVCKPSVSHGSSQCHQVPYVNINDVLSFIHIWCIFFLNNRGFK